MKDPSGVYKPFTKEKKFWANVGESDCKCGQGQGRIDPVLKLYKNIPLMMTINTNVSKGQANGTRLTLKKVLLKQGQSPSIMEINGTKVNAVRGRTT